MTIYKNKKSKTRKTQTRKTQTRKKFTKKGFDNFPYDMKKFHNKFPEPKKYLLTKGWKQFELQNENLPEITNNSIDFFQNFKRLFMEAPVRKFFIEKSYPNIVRQNRYFFIKFDYNDVYKQEKIDFIKKVKETSEDFIIDLAVQYKNDGGHYTSLKKINGVLEYMDSDPFFYGSTENNELYEILKDVPNPISIYGDKNLNRRLKFKAKKSIQNLNKSDTYCQSWSLLFLTMSTDLELYPGVGPVYEKLQFQEINAITFEDKKKQVENIDKFLNNFKFLLNFWIKLFEKNNDFDILIKSSKQWEKWSRKKIINRLKIASTNLENNKDNIIENYKSKMDVENDFENIKEINVLDPVCIRNRDKYLI